MSLTVLPSNGAGGYNITDSLRIRESASAYLSRTPTITGDRQKFTVSTWVKCAKQDSSIILNSIVSTGNRVLFRFSGTNKQFHVVISQGGVNYGANSNVYLRDPSAWYHLVLSVDTTQATATDRLKGYVNGEEITSWASYNNIPQNTNMHINYPSATMAIGADTYAASYLSDAYYAEYNYVDGQALTPSDFGEYNPITGVWQPKAYTGTYGTNGFYLPMKETTQATGFNTVTYNGNGTELKVTGVGFQPDLLWVKRRDNAVSYHRLIDSVRGGDKRLASNDTGGETTASTLIQSFDADGYTVGTDTGMNASGDRYVAWCWDANSDNTTSSELITNGTFDTNTSGWTNVNSSISSANQKLNATYTSSGAYVYQEVTGLTVGQKYMLSFQSTGSNDFIRVLRDAQTEGLGGTFISFLGGNATTASGLNQVFFEAPTTTVYINFNIPNGGTIIIDDISLKQVSYDGTIPSYTKTNTSTGFSIVSWTSGGTTTTETVGHGMGSTPSMIILKNRDLSDNWWVWHNTFSNPEYDYLNLNGTGAISTNINPMWGASGGMSSSTFGIREGGFASNGQRLIAYCFSEVAGYSKFDSYTGNGSTSGPTVTTGFRPAFVMVKRTDTTGSWRIFDSTRSVDNPRNDHLKADGSDAESVNDSALAIDFNDTGFQLVGTGLQANASGGTYIYMAFADTRDNMFNFDASGNKNNWTPTNINSNASSEPTYDLMSDTPSLVDEDTGNFATLNPLLIADGGTMSDGNLTFTTPTATRGFHAGTIGMTSGKWYWEVTCSASTYNTTNRAAIGYKLGNERSSYVISGTDGDVGNMGFYTGDTVGFAFDADNGTLENFINGVSNATYTSIDMTKTWFPIGADAHTAQNGTVHWNFGQRPFKYTPPTGYKKLNTYNLSDSSIKDGSQYMNIKLWTGNGTNQDIDVGWNPDLVWHRNRTDASGGVVTDSIRGDDLHLQTTNANAEGAFANFEFITNGYNVSGNANLDNQSGKAYVGWNWRGSDSAPVTNTVGDISSTVSANPTSGFSVVTWTGNGGSNQSVGHGLSEQPDMVIIKKRNKSENWYVATTSSGYDTNFGYHLHLNTTGVVDGNNDPYYLNSIGSVTDKLLLSNGTSNNGGNENGIDYVAYCWHSVEGYSKIGNYIGNGSADGTFVYTGFTPSFVLMKDLTSANSWIIMDKLRTSEYNPQDGWIVAHSTSAEYNVGSSDSRIDLVSNGFKLRNANAGNNGSGRTYLYMAFAENPFKNSLAR